jgi:hypothetical protein
MSWNPYYYAAHLGQEVRDHRGRGESSRVPQQPLSPRVPPRDPRVPHPGHPIGPRVPPRDPRPQRPQEPDPRVTTRPEDLRPRDDDRDRDRDRDRRHHHRHRRYREQHDLPWGHRYYGDYIFLAGYGWLPRWYPYWDPSWFDYWWFLFDYYGGDTAADYAAYARDVVLRGYARQYGWI